MQLYVPPDDVTLDSVMAELGRPFDVVATSVGELDICTLTDAV